MALRLRANHLRNAVDRLTGRDRVQLLMTDRQTRRIVIALTGFMLCDSAGLSAHGCQLHAMGRLTWTSSAICLSWYHATCWRTTSWRRAENPTPDKDEPARAQGIHHPDRSPPVRIGRMRRSTGLSFVFSRRIRSRPSAISSKSFPATLTARSRTTTRSRFMTAYASSPHPTPSILCAYRPGR